MRRIVLAPDSFKGCMSATEVCAGLARGIVDAGFTGAVESVPMADGGEGTLDALASFEDLEIVTIRVRDPLLRTIDARYAVARDGTGAIVETASACGLGLLSEEERDPHRATTYGAGELLRDAIQRGARKLLVGIGGSATVDGGAGLAAAFGYRFLDERGRDLSPGGLALRELHAIEPPLQRSWDGVEIEVACDVDSPLLGSDGAARVYGPQKGRAPDAVDVVGLERGLEKLAASILALTGRDISAAPFGGAAGGMGAGLVCLLDARLRRGFDVVKERTRLVERMRGADCVVTGEGRTDEQTLRGKVCAGVAETARSQGIPCILVSGRIDPELRVRLPLHDALPLAREGESIDESLRHAPERLRWAGGEIVRRIGSARWPGASDLP